MKRLIVQILEKLSLFQLFLALLAGTTAGYAGGGPVGAVAGFLVALVFCSLFFGVLFILLEMNDNVRKIRQQLENISVPQPEGASKGLRSGR